MPLDSSRFQHSSCRFKPWSFWNHDGFQETVYWHLDSHWELKNAHEFHTGINVSREGVVVPFEIYPGIVVPTGTYDHVEAQPVFQTNQGAAVSGRVSMNIGGFFGGDRVQLNSTMRIRSGETFSTELSWTRNDIDLPAGSFMTNLARARVSYSFTPRVFVQSLIQYNDRDELWSTNFRFGWLQQANTGVFVVYTDSHTFDDFGLESRRPDRSFIVKVSRMFDVLN